jgi:hypothetical protein
MGNRSASLISITLTPVVPFLSFPPNKVYKVVYLLAQTPLKVKPQGELEGMSYFLADDLPRSWTGVLKRHLAAKQLIS